MWFLRPGFVTHAFSGLILTPAALIAAFALTLASAAPTAARAGTQADETTQAAMHLLRNAVIPQRNGSHLTLLFALRQLRDPELKTLYYQLAQNADWQLQVHAVLGLGEIDPNHHIDPWLMTKIAPQAQEAVVATGLDLDLMGPEQIEEILRWDQLSSTARVFLLAEQASKGLKVDPAEVARLSASEENNIAGLAACIAAQLGDPGPMQAFLGRIGALDPDARISIQLWLLEAVRRYRLKASQGWVQQVLQEQRLDAEVAYRAVFTLLALDPELGMVEWNRLLGEDPTYQQRVRYGLVLLATGATVPAIAYDRLTAGSTDELIDKIAALGKAISNKADQSDALIQLLDLGHLKSTDWAMEHLAEIPNDQASKVYSHEIDLIGKDPGAQENGIALAIQSTTQLAKINLDLVLSRLREAPDDSLMQQALLLGLFEVNSSSVGEAAAALRRIGSGRADSLALLLMAKHAKSLSAEDLQKLGGIAAGGGRVSQVLQVQAAWMYLRQTGQVESALAVIFAKP